MLNLVIDKKIEYFHSSYVDSDFLYLNLSITEDVLEKIYLKNVYYVKKKIMVLNI